MGDPLLDAMCAWTDDAIGEPHGPWCTQNTEAEQLADIARTFITAAVADERKRIGDTLEALYDQGMIDDYIVPEVMAALTGGDDERETR